MSPTITIVVPRAEKESVFLLQAVRAAIHAYRYSHLRGPEVLIDGAKLIELERRSFTSPERNNIF